MDLTTSATATTQKVAPAAGHRLSAPGSQRPASRRWCGVVGVVVIIERNVGDWLAECQGRLGTTAPVAVRVALQPLEQHAPPPWPWHRRQHARQDATHVAHVCGVVRQRGIDGAVAEPQGRCDGSRPGTNAGAAVRVCRRQLKGRHAVARAQGQLGGTRHSRQQQPADRM